MQAVTGRSEDDMMLSQEPVSNDDDILLNLKTAHASDQVWLLYVPVFHILELERKTGAHS